MKSGRITSSSSIFFYGVELTNPRAEQHGRSQKQTARPRRHIVKCHSYIFKSAVRPPPCSVGVESRVPVRSGVTTVNNPQAIAQARHAPATAAIQRAAGTLEVERQESGGDDRDVVCLLRLKGALAAWPFYAHNLQP